MKVLVVYYSMSGITKAVAEAVAKELNADIEQIKEVKSRGGVGGFLTSGYQAMGGKSAKIEGIQSKVEDYDLVIIGTPIWAGRTSSPVNAFLSGFATKIKNYAIIMTRANRQNDYAPVTEIFASRCKKPALAFLSMCATAVKAHDFVAVDDFVAQIKKLDVAGK